MRDLPLVIGMILSGVVVFDSTQVSGAPRPTLQAAPVVGGSSTVLDDAGPGSVRKKPRPAATAKRKPKATATPKPEPKRKPKAKATATPTPTATATPVATVAPTATPTPAPVVPHDPVTVTGTAPRWPSGP